MGLVIPIGCVIKSIPLKMGSESWGVEVTWHGHSCFTLRDSHGRTIVIDPFDETVGFGRLKISADALFISHVHFDHNFRKGVYGRTKQMEVVETTGTYTVAAGMTVKAVPSYHDLEFGDIYGKNKIFSFSMGGLRIVHMGDLGQTALTENQIALIGRPDILFIPVGGFTTLGANQAAALGRQLKARVIIPMHYGDTRFYKLDPVTNFTQLFPDENVVFIEDSRYRFKKKEIFDGIEIFVFSKPESGD